MVPEDELEYYESLGREKQTLGQTDSPSEGLGAHQYGSFWVSKGLINLPIFHSVTLSQAWATAKADVGAASSPGQRENPEFPQRNPVVRAAVQAEVGKQHNRSGLYKEQTETLWLCGSWSP
jgi:hypothetical protein